MLLADDTDKDMVFVSENQCTGSFSPQKSKKECGHWVSFRGWDQWSEFPSVLRHCWLDDKPTKIYADYLISEGETR